MLLWPTNALSNTSPLEGVSGVSNRRSDAFHMTKRGVARFSIVDLATPSPSNCAFDEGEPTVIVKSKARTGRCLALDRSYIMLKPVYGKLKQVH